MLNTQRPIHDILITQSAIQYTIGADPKSVENYPDPDSAQIMI